MANKHRKEIETVLKQVRYPKSMQDDLEILSSYFMTSVNSLCVEFLREGVKNKLKEIE